MYGDVLVYMCISVRLYCLCLANKLNGQVQVLELKVCLVLDIIAKIYFKHRIIAFEVQIYNMMFNYPVASLYNVSLACFSQTSH